MEATFGLLVSPWEAFQKKEAGLNEKRLAEISEEPLVFKAGEVSFEVPGGRLEGSTRCEPDSPETGIYAPRSSLLLLRLFTEKGDKCYLASMPLCRKP